MALFFPVLDWATAALWFVGSPALGYIVLRTAWPSCQAWSGTLRGFVALILGGGWSLLALTALAPGVSNPVALHPNQIAEFTGALGMGVILLTLFAGLLSRFVWYRYIAPWNPGMMPPITAPATWQSENDPARPRTPPKLPPAPTRTTSTLRAPDIESGPAKNEAPRAPTPTPIPRRMYKPSQLKLTSRPRGDETHADENAEADHYATTSAPPSSGEDDVLGLLRDEAASEGKPIPGRAQEEERRAPISQLGEFAGFDETLTQLKRDLKAFNESVDIHSKKKGNGA